MNGNIYVRYVKGRAKKSPVAKNCLWAFLSGGLICTVAEVLKIGYTMMGATEEDAGTIATFSLIFVASLLTGLGVFDKFAKHCGAGTLVPITGFANAITSSAIDSRTEGYVLGVGAKIFTVAGPVIVYGLTAGVVYGLVLYFFG